MAGYRLLFSPETGLTLTVSTKILYSADRGVQQYITDIFESAVHPNADDDTYIAAVRRTFHEMANNSLSTLSHVFVDQQLWEYSKAVPVSRYADVGSNWGYSFIYDAVLAWTLETAQYFRTTFRPVLPPS